MSRKFQCFKRILAMALAVVAIAAAMPAQTAHAIGVPVYAKPTISSVTPTSTGITIKWSKSSGASYYSVYYRYTASYTATNRKGTSSLSSWTKAGTTTGTSYTLTLPKLSAQKVEVRVRVTNKNGTVGWSSYSATKSTSWVAAPGGISILGYNASKNYVNVGLTSWPLFDDEYGDKVVWHFQYSTDNFKSWYQVDVTGNGISMGDGNSNYVKIQLKANTLYYFRAYVTFKTSSFSGSSVYTPVFQWNTNYSLNPYV